MRRVTPLESGALLETKLMEGSSGSSFPKHRASIESVLVVIAGRCIIRFSEVEHALEAGDSFLVPADDWHQITADSEFKAVHVMPKEIEFVFST